MRTTLIQLKAEFKQIQEAHGQLNSFFWGAPDRAVMESTPNYPLMCCYVTSAPVNVSRRVTSLSVAVVVVDKVYKDYASLDDTISDTLQVIRDVQNTMHSPRWLKMIQKPTASGSKIFNSEQDEISGWAVQFKIDIKDDGSYCNLPMGDYDFDAPESTPGECAVSTIINSTATYFQQVDSGATFELPNISHIDTDGTPTPTPAQTPFICSQPTSIVVYNRVYYTGNNDSFSLYDEAWQAENGTYDFGEEVGKTQRLDYSSSAPFYTLVYDNIFNTKDRFTDELGTQLYAANITIDHLTGLMWKNDSNGFLNYTTAAATAEASTFGGYSDWRLSSYGEMASISDTTMFRSTNNPPYFLVDANCICSSRNSAGSAIEFRQTSVVANRPTNSNAQHLIVRTL